MPSLTFSLNVTLDGCVDHREGVADDETHAYYTRLMDDSGAMLWGRTTYELTESYWPAVARGEVDAAPALRAWATSLEAKPKYVVSTTRTEFPWNNSHRLDGDLRTAVQDLKNRTPAGVLLGSGLLATELDRLDLIDEYRFLVHRDRRPWPHPVPGRAARLPPPRADLRGAARQRRGRRALPSAGLTSGRRRTEHRPHPLCGGSVL